MATEYDYNDMVRQSNSITAETARGVDTVALTQEIREVGTPKSFHDNKKDASNDLWIYISFFAIVIIFLIVSIFFYLRWRRVKWHSRNSDLPSLKRHGEKKEPYIQYDVAPGDSKWKQEIKVINESIRAEIRSIKEELQQISTYLTQMSRVVQSLTDKLEVEKKSRAEEEERRRLIDERNVYKDRAHELLKQNEELEMDRKRCQEELHFFDRFLPLEAIKMIYNVIFESIPRSDMNINNCQVMSIISSWLDLYVSSYNTSADRDLVVKESFVRFDSLLYRVLRDDPESLSVIRRKIGEILVKMFREDFLFEWPHIGDSYDPQKQQSLSNKEAGRIARVESGAVKRKNGDLISKAQVIVE